jgi:hypothetical protein
MASKSTVIEAKPGVTLQNEYHSAAAILFLNAGPVYRGQAPAMDALSGRRSRGRMMASQIRCCSYPGGRDHEGVASWPPI